MEALRATEEGRHPRVAHGVARGGFPVGGQLGGWRWGGLARPVRLGDSELRAEWMWARWETRMAGVLTSGPTESTMGTHREREREPSGC